jgi:general L-amino acid transport system permease protein
MALLDEQSSRTIASDVEQFAEIPWYRDIRVLRALAQIIFLFGVIAFSIVLVNNLLTNLETSNISLDFGIYARPFSVGLSEGPSATNQWQWLADTSTIETGVTVFYIVLFAAIIGALWINRSAVAQVWDGITRAIGSAVNIANTGPDGNPRLNVTVLIQQEQSLEERRRQRLRNADANPTQAALLILALILLILFAITFPPSRIPDEMNRYLYGGSMTRAFITGVANTLRVVVFALVASTVLGVLVGIGLLSRNFLLRGVSTVFVEIFRNTPLLVQLLFIYRVLTLLLPRPLDSIYASDVFPILGPGGGELFAINTGGLYLATPQASGQFALFAGIMLVAFVICAVIRRRRLHQQETTGQPARIFKFTLPIWLIAFTAAWILTGSWPLGGEGAFQPAYPELVGRQVEGGTHLTTAFFALFLGLTFYTGAFIAEIVRAGIQSVPYGQIEAARSQGFTSGQVLQLVVLPQALRLIIPPLGNQYVNLGKNSSLGIFVTYIDLFRVANLANNESGQAVPFFVGLMILYLALSLVLSILTNFVNRSTRLRTR